MHGCRCENISYVVWPGLIFRHDQAHGQSGLPLVLDCILGL